jgi:hypothetical protein
VFKRSSSVDAALEPADDATSQAPAASAAKGRPTPKRKVAEARNRTTVIAQSGGKRGRGSREQAAARREAFKRGDESVLPARDRGPVRRWVRDYVDSRRSIISWFIPAALLILVLSPFGAIGAVVQIVFVVAVIVETTLMTRRIRADVRQRFPGESTRGLGYYAFTRAMMFRRMRMPAPRVERGAKI